MDRQTVEPLGGSPSRNRRRMSDSEAEEIRALLRRPPLKFYGQLEDEARQRSGKIIASAKRGCKSRWMI
jgi:hypothetical protein